METVPKNADFKGGRFFACFPLRPALEEPEDEKLAQSCRATSHCCRFQSALQGNTSLIKERRVEPIGISQGSEEDASDLRESAPRAVNDQPCFSCQHQCCYHTIFATPPFFRHFQDLDTAAVGTRKAMPTWSARLREAQRGG